jgi:hypothetical protein
MRTGTENTKHSEFAELLIVKSTNLYHEQKWRDWHYPTSTVHCDTHFNGNGTCGFAGHLPAKCLYWSYHSQKTYVFPLRAHRIITLAFSASSASQDQTINTYIYMTMLQKVRWGIQREANSLLKCTQCVWQFMDKHSTLPSVTHMTSLNFVF